MAVVITHGIGGGEIGDPSGFKQREQPRLVLTRNRDGTRDRERERAAAADGGVEDRVDAPEKCATECGEAVHQDLVDGIAFVDSSDFYGFLDRLASNFRLAVIVWFHKWNSYSS